MQVAGGKRLRSGPKSPHCSINKNKQRERKGKKKENESEIVANEYNNNKDLPFVISQRTIVFQQHISTVDGTLVCIWW